MGRVTLKGHESIKDTKIKADTKNGNDHSVLCKIRFGQIMI